MNDLTKIRKTRINNRQQGIGIFMALILVVLITAVIASVATMTTFNIKRSSIINQITMANAYHHSAEDFAKQTLLQSYTDADFDSTASRWHYKMPEYPLFIANSDTNIGAISGYINDMGTRFNLNDLHNLTKLQLDSFTRLGNIVSLDSSKVNNIINLMKTNNNVFSKTDIFLLAGLNADDISKISPYTALINSNAKININLVSPQVLAAYSDISLSQAKNITNDLAKNQIQDSAALNTFIADNLSNDVASGGVFSINSKYFQIVTEVRIEKQTSTMVSNVIRINRNTIITTSTRREKFNDE